MSIVSNIYNVIEIPLKMLKKGRKKIKGCWSRKKQNQGVLHKFLTNLQSCINSSKIFARPPVIFPSEIDFPICFLPILNVFTTIILILLTYQLQLLLRLLPLLLLRLLLQLLSNLLKLLHCCTSSPPIVVADPPSLQALSLVRRWFRNHDPLLHS